MKKSTADKRHRSTLSLINKYIDKNEEILDLGVKNPFSEILIQNGYIVENTSGEDLDLKFDFSHKKNIQAVTAIEILEHLISPFPLLQNLPGNKLIATVPLRLWFKKAYRHPTRVWGWHYHEFEDWQFDRLLEKSGWHIVHREKWYSRSKNIGIRPLLRMITPRYYAVYAERK